MEQTVGFCAIWYQGALFLNLSFQVMDSAPYDAYQHVYINHDRQKLGVSIRDGTEVMGICNMTAFTQNGKGHATP